MQISLIAALSENYVIGNGGQLLWHLPDDFKYFKSVTINKPIVMGRKTFDSIGKPLPGRLNIVLTRDVDWEHDGVEVVSTVDQALAAAGDVDECMIIGGEQIYRLFLPLAQKLYLTWVDYPGEGDAHFPDFDQNDWQITALQQHPRDEKHEFAFRFVNYVRAAS